MEERLANELLDAMNNTGASVKKLSLIHIFCADFLYDAFLNKVSGNGRYCCRSNLCLLGNRGACNRCIAENVFQYEMCIRDRRYISR